MQNRQVPSFFRTNTTGEAHGLLLGRMTPWFSIFATSCCTTPFSATGNRLCGWRIGGAEVLMPCLTVVV